MVLDGWFQSFPGAPFPPGIVQAGCAGQRICFAPFASHRGAFEAWRLNIADM